MSRGSCLRRILVGMRGWHFVRSFISTCRILDIVQVFVVFGNVHVHISVTCMQHTTTGIFEGVQQLLWNIYTERSEFCNNLRVFPCVFLDRRGVYSGHGPFHARGADLG